MKYKRVSFRLTPSLANNFKQAAQKEGIQQSVLLRRWIKKLDLQGAKVITGINPTPLYKTAQSWKIFDVRLTYNDLFTLETTMSQLGLTQTEVIRRLVEKFSVKGSMVFTELQQVGADNSLYSLNNTQLINKAKNFINKGELAETDLVVDLLESRLLSKPRAHPDLIAVDILRGSLARHRRQLRNSRRLLLQAAEHATHQRNMYLISQANSQLGVLADIDDNITSALYYQQASCECINDNNSLIELKLRLLGLYALQHDYVKIQSLQEEIAGLSNGLSEIELSRLNNRLALVDIRIGDLATAFARLELSYDTQLVKSSLVEQRYVAENLGAVMLFAGEYQKAEKLLAKARSLELNFRRSSNDSSFSKNKLFLLHIKAKENFAKAFSEAREVVELQLEPVYQGLGRYLLYSLQFLSSGELAQQNIGRNKLRQLANSGPNHMIRNAVEMTLKHRILWPVI